MWDPFLAEIKLCSFNFAPKGWAFCNGQLLPINQNQALFSLLGTTYGGNGQTNFALPDLRGRAPLHFGSGLTLGQRGGEEVHTVTTSEMPTHTHFLRAQTEAVSADEGPQDPSGKVFASASTALQGGTQVQVQLYNNQPAASSLVAMSPLAVGNVGGSLAHQNMQPYLVLNYVIALIGIFPSPN